MTRDDELKAVAAVHGPCLGLAYLIGDEVEVLELGVMGVITGIGTHHILRMYIVSLSPADAHGLEGYSVKATTLCLPASSLRRLRTPAEWSDSVSSSVVEAV
jgi:hypothetical protein